MRFFEELKRRNVLRMAGLYLVGAWLIVQVSSTVLPAFDLPSWGLRAVIVLLAIGFVPAMVFAWVFELTPEGLKREKLVDPNESIMPETGRKLDRAIMIALALALGYFAFDKFVLAPRRDAALEQRTSEQIAEARKQGGENALARAHDDKSIAVLPFLDMSQSKDQEYLSDGIAEELLNLLAKVRELRVTSRSSAFSFKGKDVDIPTIARQLNVANVLEGSVRKAGNQVRVTVQLIQTGSDTHLWSQTYDRPLDNIFAIQDEIAAAVVAQLKVALLGAAPKSTVTDPAAYALFLQGRQFERDGTPDTIERAIEVYQQALAIAPDYVAAWERLAAVYQLQAGRGMRPVEEAIRLARHALAKALTLDPAYPAALADQGFIALLYDRDLAASADYIARALTLEPGNSEIIRYASRLAISLNRMDLAIALGQRFAELDPTNATGLGTLCRAYLHAGRYDEAIDCHRKTIALSPRIIAVHQYLVMALLMKDSHANAQAALDAAQAEPAESYRLYALALAHFALGNRAASDAALEEAARKYERDSSYNIAYVYAWRNEADLAFLWLDKAALYNDTGLTDLAVSPLFKSIHDDPRWAAYLAKVGYSPAQLAAIPFDVKVPGSTPPPTKAGSP
ncbi:MAG TPA: hypothetical protein VLC97_00100 [Rhodanobacteraceae bacterium]|nr:hypothetical protein [Rhodanobacteraceae bacterium]